MYLWGHWCAQTSVESQRQDGRQPVSPSPAASFNVCRAEQVLRPHLGGHREKGRRQEAKPRCACPQSQQPLGLGRGRLTGSLCQGFLLKKNQGQERRPWDHIKAQMSHLREGTLCPSDSQVPGGVSTVSSWVPEAGWTMRPWVPLTLISAWAGGHMV